MYMTVQPLYTVCKEYLNIGDIQIGILLLMMRWTLPYISRFPTSVYAKFIRFENGPVRSRSL